MANPSPWAGGGTSTPTAGSGARGTSSKSRCCATWRAPPVQGRLRRASLRTRVLVEFFVDFYFIADVFLSFVTGYGGVGGDQACWCRARVNANGYLRTWFPIDAVACALWIS